VIYEPTAEDTAWMRSLVASLNIGGIWGYKDRPIVFQKTAERTMTLITAPVDDREVDEQIERNKVVMRRAGITFEDGRIIK
jgi:hypothetical protein